MLIDCVKFGKGKSIYCIALIDDFNVTSIKYA